MTPRATFYPKPKTNFTGFNTADLLALPHIKDGFMVSEKVDDFRMAINSKRNFKYLHIACFLVVKIMLIYAKI